MLMQQGELFIFQNVLLHARACLFNLPGLI